MSGPLKASVLNYVGCLQMCFCMFGRASYALQMAIPLFSVKLTSLKCEIFLMRQYDDTRSIARTEVPFLENICNHVNLRVSIFKCRCREKFYSVEKITNSSLVFVLVVASRTVKIRWPVRCVIAHYPQRRESCPKYFCVYQAKQDTVHSSLFLFLPN